MKRMMLAIAGGAMLLAGGPAPAADIDDRIVRKMAVVEKIFDTMLIDSKYALVSSGTNTVGVYLPGHGALLTMEFSFVEDSHHTILESLEDLEGIVENWQKLLEMSDEERSKADAHRRILFDRVIDELRQALLDYGGTMSFLKDDESISIAAFPWGDTWEVTPEPIVSLLVTVRASDLRAYNQSSMSESELLSRIIVTEQPE